MKILVKVIFSTLLNVVFTGVYINCVKVDSTCVPKIENLLKNRCEDGYETIEKKVKCILLYIDRGDLRMGFGSCDIRTDLKIVENYMEFIFRAVKVSDTEQYLNPPTEFCANYTNPKCEEAFGNRGIPLETQQGIVKYFYRNISLKESSSYIKTYLQGINEKIIFNGHFQGSHIPKSFCEMKKCDNQIRSDLLSSENNIFTIDEEVDQNFDEADLPTKSYVHYVLLNNIQRNLSNKKTKGYVEHLISTIVTESINLRMMSISQFCSLSRFSRDKNCLQRFVNGGFSLLANSNEGNLRHLFYNFTQVNPTVSSQWGEASSSIQLFRGRKPLTIVAKSLEVNGIEGDDIDYVKEYVNVIIDQLQFNDSTLRAASSPDAYCSYLAEIKKN